MISHGRIDDPRIIWKMYQPRIQRIYLLTSSLRDCSQHLRTMFDIPTSGKKNLVLSECEWDSRAANLQDSKNTTGSLTSNSRLKKQWIIWSGLWLSCKKDFFTMKTETGPNLRRSIQPPLWLDRNRLLWPARPSRRGKACRRWGRVWRARPWSNPCRTNWWWWWTTDDRLQTVKQQGGN